MKKLTFICLLGVACVLVVAFFLGGLDLQLLNPHGEIALHQRSLIVTATLIMLIIVAPVMASLFFIAVKYREGNKDAKYSPENVVNLPSQLLWWAGPTAIILVVAALIWKNTHLLDPYRPLSSKEPPIDIQVVALRWKWLFIYPKENIATVNYIQFPNNTPINFELTADAPMNSFWIPQLGGQVYAMTGMVTKLHLVANEKGKYVGKAAEISGNGFSGMTFIAKSSSKEEYNAWLKTAKTFPRKLDAAEYERLVKPSTDAPVVLYSAVDKTLYNGIIMKYMSPNSDKKSTEEMEDMH